MEAMAPVQGLEFQHCKMNENLNPQLALGMIAVCIKHMCRVLLTVQVAAFWARAWDRRVASEAGMQDPRPRPVIADSFVGGAGILGMFFIWWRALKPDDER